MSTPDANGHSAPTPNGAGSNGKSALTGSDPELFAAVQALPVGRLLQAALATGGPAEQHRTENGHHNRGLAKQAVPGWDVTEVGLRSVCSHWLLIAFFILLGAATALGYLRYARYQVTWSSSARVALDAPDPHLGTESAALADTARAIVTSPTHVAAALTAVGTQRDVDFMLRNNLVVARSEGTSAVVDISVKDPDRQVAAKLANQLAADLIQTRLSVALDRAQRDQILSDLQSRIDDLGTQISQADARVSALGGSPLTGSVTSQRSNLVQEKVALESARDSLLAAAALQPKAQVIEPAIPALKHDIDRRMVGGAIGGVAGLLLGLLLASLIETLRPTLVNPRAVALAMAAPLLGRVRSLRRKLALPDSLPVRLRLAAASAGVNGLKLVAVEPRADLSALAATVRSQLAAQGAAEDLQVEIEKTTPSVGWLDTASVRPGVLLVSPGKLRKSQLAPASDLLAMTGWPLLGVITYRRRRFLGR